MLSFGNAVVNHYCSPPPRERIPLAVLQIPQLTYGALRRAGFTYLDEVSHLTDRQLRLIRGIGDHGVQIIHSMVKQYHHR